MRLMILAVLAVLTASPAEAGLFRCRGKAKVVVRWRGCYCTAPCNAAPSALLPCQAVPTAVPSPQVGPQAPAKVLPMPGPVGYGGEAATFLAALNLWRAANGRGPVGWDQTLAAWAATNTGYSGGWFTQHDGRSSGGGYQVSVPLASALAALESWKASPAHNAILLLPRAAVVGWSVCAFGSCANLR